MSGGSDVVARGDGGPLVAFEADVTDGHLREELEHRAKQPQAGAEDRHRHDAVRNRVAVRLLERRLYRKRPAAQVAGRLVQQQRDDPVRELAKLVGWGVAIAETSEVMGDERMLNEM